MSNRSRSLIKKRYKNYIENHNNGYYCDCLKVHMNVRDIQSPSDDPDKCELVEYVDYYDCMNRIYMMSSYKLSINNNLLIVIPIRISKYVKSDELGITKVTINKIYESSYEELLLSDEEEYFIIIDQVQTESGPMPVMKYEVQSEFLEVVKMTSDELYSMMTPVSDELISDDLLSDFYKDLIDKIKTNNEGDTNEY